MNVATAQHYKTQSADWMMAAHALWNVLRKIPHDPSCTFHRTRTGNPCDRCNAEYEYKRLKAKR